VQKQKRRLPPDPVRPITADKVREIIEGLEGRYVVPSDDDMARLAAVYTGMQYCNLPPEQEFRDFPIRLLDVLGNEMIIPTPLWPPGVRPCDWNDRTRADGTIIGHLRVEVKTWRDLAADMAAEFRRAMEPPNPGRRFGNKYAVPQFLKEVIPLIFSDQKPSVGTIWQQLARPYKRKRLKKRIR
jgi:hypothetical protein